MIAPTIEAARRALAAILKSAAIESAELDARILTGHALGLDLTGLISAAQRELTPNESARLKQFACRRLAGEPVARILGEKEFWGLPLQLSSASLVPRPDTETVVELALELLRAAGGLDRPLRIADLGTGSGDRSERIRTYNFPQGRVTDHRINLTLYNLARIIAGDGLGEIVDALVAQDQADRLAEFEAADQ